MSYLPDPTDSSQPVASVKASTAAEEFRALKAYIAGLAGLTPITAISALTVQALNGGQLAGFRNRVRNSGCQITQRANGTLSATPTIGAVDGYYWSTTGSGVSGTIQQVSTSQFPATTVGSGIVGNWTTGAPQVEQRIESYDTKDLDEKTITISCRLYHDIGSTVPFRIQLNRPTTTADDFSAETMLAQGAAQDCPTGVATQLSATFNAAGQDVSKGLAIQVFATSNTTAAGKIVAISELQLEPGTVVTPFEHVPLSVELTRCQRYYETGTVYYDGYSSAGGPVAGDGAVFKVTKRSTPTLAFGAYTNVGNSAVGSTRSSTVGAFYRYAVAVALGVATGYETWAASSEL